MKVGLYYPWVHLTSGAERVVFELATRSRHQYTILTNHFDAEHTFPGLQNLDIRELSRVSVRRNVFTTAVNCGKILGQRLPLEGFDALVVLCEGLGDLAVFRNGHVPAVCLCLTPLRAAFDHVYRQEALERRGLLGRLALRAGTGLFRIVDRLAWSRYHSIVCVSEEVRRRTLAAHLAGPEKVSIAYPGPCVEAREPGAAYEEYFLLPGRIMWTKNIELGIRAFLRLRSEHPSAARFRLIVAGLVDHKSHGYLDRLRSMAGQNSGIEFVIQPPDAELTALYRNCRAVLFTAFNEDWGIVPLEAMACGKPVIAVNRGGPRETVVDGVTGFLEEPEDQRFSARMAELAADSQMAQRLGQAGQAWVTKFDWKLFAEHVDEAVESACRAVRASPVSESSYAGQMAAANESRGRK